MAYVVEWLVKDKTNPDKIYVDVADFFKDSEDDELIKQHLDIEENRVLRKVDTLAEDGKSFRHFKHFENEAHYTDWLEKKDKLPIIDEHLDYLRINKN